MDSRKSLGEMELDLLRYLSENGEMSVRQVTAGFGEERGYARTTILTVMERLRKKGYATRKKEGSVYLYTSAHSKTDLMRDVVQRFVKKALGGSVSPLVAYLSDEQDLSDEEIANLRRLVSDLDDREESND